MDIFKGNLHLSNILLALQHRFVTFNPLLEIKAVIAVDYFQ